MTTKDNQSMFLIVFKACNGNISRTCDSVGIARQTFYNWMEDEDSEFPGLIAALQFEAVERRVDLAEGKLDDRLNLGSGPDIRFVLKTLGARRGYGSKATVTVEPGAGFKGMEWPEETDDLKAWEAERDKQMPAAIATQPQQGTREAPEEGKERAREGDEGAGPEPADG